MGLVSSLCNGPAGGEPGQVWQHSTRRTCFPGKSQGPLLQGPAAGGAGRGSSHLLKPTLAAARRLRLAQPACPKAPLACSLHTCSPREGDAQGMRNRAKNVTPPWSCHHEESEGQSRPWLLIYLFVARVCCAPALCQSKHPGSCALRFWLPEQTHWTESTSTESPRAGQGLPSTPHCWGAYQATRLSLCWSPQGAQAFGRKNRYIPGPASAMVLSNETALGPVLIEDKRRNQGCGARTFREAPPSLQPSGGSGKDGGSKPPCGFLEKRQRRMESRQCRSEPARRARDLTRANQKAQLSAKAHANLN